MAMAIELYNRSYSILIYMAEESVSFWLSAYKFTYFILYDLESVCRFFIFIYIYIYIYIPF